MKILSAIGLLSISWTSFAQKSDADFSLKNVFGGGTMKGSVRQYSMYTQNKGSLSDFYGVAIGAGLNYETKKWRHLQFNFGGIFVNDIISSNFLDKDSLTQASSRYDSGLYDVTGLGNKSFLSRVESLNISYHFQKTSKIVLGKQLIKSPLVNPQDGRMNKSLMGGLYLYANDLGKLKIEGGWLNNSGPRSTFGWYKINNSIGVYPMGVNAQGKRNNYLQNLDSKGLFVVGLQYSNNANNKIQLWNYTIENISNSSFLQWNYAMKAFNWGIQSTFQKGIGNGGNKKPELAYIDPSHKSFTYGLMIQKKQKNNSIQANYTRITKLGQFLFPREWGRDAFFTFMPRERNEGLADVNAFTLNYNKNFKSLLLEISCGYYDLPDVKNYAANKYGMPSYSQLNLNVKYAFKNNFEGLNMEFLIAKKWKEGSIYNDEKYRINKVDMTNFNLIINYGFQSK